MSIIRGHREGSIHADDQLSFDFRFENFTTWKHLPVYRIIIMIFYGLQLLNLVTLRWRFYHHWCWTRWESENFAFKLKAGHLIFLGVKVRVWTEWKLDIYFFCYQHGSWLVTMSGVLLLSYHRVDQPYVLIYIDIDIDIDMDMDMLEMGTETENQKYHAHTYHTYQT